MSKLSDQQKIIQSARDDRNTAEHLLRVVKNRLLKQQDRLNQLGREGDKHEEELVRLRNEIEQLKTEIGKKSVKLADASRRLREAKDSPPIFFQRPQKLIEELDDSIPILLLPVRVETRFMAIDSGTELWVRIFPDDIAIDGHEKLLTTDEVEAGRLHWREVWHAQQQSDEEERLVEEKGAWRALAGEYGSSRAAWVASETRPVTLEVASRDDLQFPVFDEDTLAHESWNRAPRSNIMPEHFVVTLDSAGLKSTKVGERLPEPLITGPDPLSDELELVQSGADLLPGPNLDWIYNFDRAVEIGMAVRMPLTPDQAKQGIDRLIVLGMRLSSDETHTKSLIEDLLSSHHFAPDGMAVIPQGTPTNNTDEERSGFTSIDPGADKSFAVETGKPMFQMEADRNNKTDGQRLIEALGIDQSPLQFIEHANRFDSRDAQLMNKALWPATLGYFLEEFLGLSSVNVRRVQGFFTDYVTGRGPLPALRIGNQPYGILPTTALGRWKASANFDDPRDPTLLDELQKIFSKLDTEWENQLGKVSNINRPGDGFENLLDTLGLHATSVEFHRRHAVGRDYRWNYLHFTFANDVVTASDESFKTAAASLMQGLGFQFDGSPKIFDLSFFDRQDAITDPFVDDVRKAEDERWSENDFLKRQYKIRNTDTVMNYLGWLVESNLDDIKNQILMNSDDERQPIPKALLYRMLRRALLLTYHDATLQLYERQRVVRAAARLEVELPNIEEVRTVTRWEFMEAKINDVMPQLSSENISVIDFLQSTAGFDLPEAIQIRDIQKCLGELAEHSTAQMERLFAEHLDLCSYRLDAWQMGLITQRLEKFRQPAEGTSERRTGLYLGSYCYLAEILPRSPKVEVPPEDIPESLRPQTASKVFEQPNNGGFIPAPSIAHAVTAAVLRSAYLSHADSEHPERMAVNLSSERVRTALRFIEGIRNGQELGALLGYQFERGLHERHGDPSLNQFILSFRNRYPLLADKITHDTEGATEDAQVESKEARNVFDGYSLVEQAFLREDPIAYPYDVLGLPPDNGIDPQVIALKAEVKRMSDSFDALADLALSEGVFQVAQGNYERGGAMMRSLTQGANPPDPEIVKTPRGGVALTQRVVINLDAGGNPTAWPRESTPRALLEPSVNELLGQVLGEPRHIRFMIRSEQQSDPDSTMTVADLKIQPIDLIYLIGADLASTIPVEAQNDAAELECRVADAYRQKQAATGITDIGDLVISFIERDVSWTQEDKTFFEILPLLRSLREIVFGCRALAADDFRLPAEASSTQDAGRRGYDEQEARVRITAAVRGLQNAVGTLTNTINAAEAASGGEADLADVALALHSIAGFGLADAIPTGKSSLLAQAKRIQARADAKRQTAINLIEFSDLTPDQIQLLTDEEKVDIYVKAAKLVMDESFVFLPRFTCSNSEEVSAAVSFRDATQSESLTRFSQNPLIVDEWLQGVAHVRDKMAHLENIMTLSDAFGTHEFVMKPLQLPFRQSGHWLAVEYPAIDPSKPDDPEAFRPEGDFLSVVQLLSSAIFDPTRHHKGLVVDEWTEVIPNKIETSGIAVHFDQPSTEPPQVALLAISPEVTGSWNWGDLEATILDTFQRAKKRAVEPDHLGETPFGHVLPAILTAVTTNRFATISTDLISQSEKAFDGTAGND